MFFIFIYSITSPPTPIPGGATCHIGRETIVKTKKEKKSPLASEMLTRVRRTNVYTPVTTQGLALFQPSKTYLSTACGKKKMAKRSKGFRSSDWSARCLEPVDFTHCTPNPCFLIRFTVPVLVSRTVKRLLNPSYAGSFFSIFSPSFVPIEKQ